MKKTFEFGKIDYNHSGRKNCPVTVDVELRENGDKLVFSACSNIWNPLRTDIYCGGQCLDEIKEYVHNPIFNEIHRLWKLYHLNDMHVGTPAQEKEINKWLEQEHYDYDYELVCEHLESYGLLVDNGYKYGSGWLYEPIPEEDLNKIKELLS